MLADQGISKLMGEGRQEFVLAPLAGLCRREQQRIPPLPGLGLGHPLSKRRVPIPKAAKRVPIAALSGSEGLPPDG